jgi:hypothetical protein
MFPSVTCCCSLHDALRRGVDERVWLRLLFFLRPIIKVGVARTEEEVGRTGSPCPVVCPRGSHGSSARPRPGEDAREADDAAVPLGPQAAVHYEPPGRLGLGRLDSGGKARVVVEQGVSVPVPVDGVRRVGSMASKGRRPVQGFGQVSRGYVELSLSMSCRKHVDAAEV